MYTENRFKPTRCMLAVIQQTLPEKTKTTSSGIQPADISDFKPSAIAIKNIPVKTNSENVTTMKTEMKPSFTETTEKRMSSHTVFETKIKTDQKLFPCSN